MACRDVSATVLMLVVTVVSLSLSLTSQANPVPYPVVKMPFEYIYANITVTDTGAYARVNGTYPFENVGYQNISMSYPLPSDATNISVSVDQDTVFWWDTSQTYKTAFGELPVINWSIAPAPDTFSVEVDYKHSVPLVGQNFTYFYAMGTWKGIYAKQMTAYVTADIAMKSIGENETLDINSYEILFNSTSQEWIWKPLERIVSRTDDTFHVSVLVQSDMFSPIEGDLLLTFRVQETIPEFSSPIPLSLLIILVLLAIMTFKSIRSSTKSI